MTNYTDDELIVRGLEIRDDIEKMKERHGEELEPYESGLQDIENALLARMLAAGTKGISSVHGTAYISPQLRVKVEDKEKFLDFVFSDAEVGATFLTKHVTKEAVSDYLEKYKLDPPGIKTTSFNQCNIRKA